MTNNFVQLRTNKGITYAYRPSNVDCFKHIEQSIRQGYFFIHRDSRFGTVIGTVGATIVPLHTVDIVEIHTVEGREDNNE